jgi:hypothetical protein
MRWRNRLILVALAGIEAAVVIAIIAYWMGRPDRPRPLPASSAASTLAAQDPSPVPTPAASPSPAPSIAGPFTPPSGTVAPTASIADAAPGNAAPEILPEHIAELDAFFTKPPGSESWSADDKRAYVKKAFEALDTRERNLEREIDLDQRRRDTEGAARAQATLDHLRSRRSEIEARLGAAKEAGGP